MSAADLGAQIDTGGGSATLTTMQGGALTARRENGALSLADAHGGTAIVTTTDIAGSNGLVHVINSVMTPAAD